jgi:O-antigen/teichoic acid export membrane protein
MLTVPGATREAFRISLIVALVVGVLALVAGYLFGFAPAAAFACFGLVLGAANSLMVQRSVLRQSAEDLPSKAALVRGVGARLAVVTVIAVATAYFFFKPGLGTFLGLAIFQVINTIVGSVPALKELRK